MHEHNTNDSENGYLLLADISGFDAYLAGVELEHAHDVLTELLELLAASLSPPLHIAAVKGDAILAYKPGVEITRGEMLIELTEATYTAFRDRLKSIARNNTCDCRACSAIPTLDLKFLVHYGEFIARPTENGRANLGGLEVDLIRDRLIKDQMEKGSRSYALFTLASLGQMGIEPSGMTRHQGEYPHLGEIQSASLDLDARYQEFCKDRKAFVIAEEADFIIFQDIAATPPVVWDWLNDPYKRTCWLRWTKWRPGIRPSGRTDIGAVNHCTHGIGSVVETIIDWRPYTYFTVEMEQASIWSSFLVTYQLEPLPDGAGTRVFFRGVLLKAPAKSLSRWVVKNWLPRKLQQDLERMAELIDEDQEKTAVAPAPEPTVVAEVSGDKAIG